MKKVKNAYNLFNTIYNSLNDAINVMNYVKHKLKHETVKHVKLDE